MEFIVNYWYIIIAAIAILAIAGYMIYVFVHKPTDEQLAKVKEWLLYAVTEAEKELGSGTGQIKLRYVYDMFIAKFSWLSKVISFESFSLLTDEALDKFRDLLDSNANLQAYVKGESSDQN